METNKWQQTQLIEDYILNKLTEEEATEFEIAYLADQACIEQLEIAKKLHEGLNTVAISVPNRQVSQTKFWWQKTLPLWSVAALLLVMLIPIRTMINSDKASQGAHQYAQLNVINMPSAQMRSEQLTNIAVNKDNKQLILAFYVDPDLNNNTFTRYRFILTSEKLRKNNNHIVQETNDIASNTDDMIYIDLGTNRLTAGEYQFSLNAINSQGESNRINQGQLAIID